jgi:DNA gyrase/topoisomerase IV subunit B
VKLVQHGFVCELYLHVKGETHVNHIVDQLIAEIDATIKKKHKSAEAEEVHQVAHLGLRQCADRKPLFRLADKGDDESEAELFRVHCRNLRQHEEGHYQMRDLDNVSSFAKYGSVMIMTYQDVDGSHIKGTNHQLFKHY